MAERKGRAPREQSREIRRFILANVAEHPNDIAALAGQRFGITRQAINRHLNALVRSNDLVARGTTRSREYVPVPIADKRSQKGISIKLPIFAELQEDRVWTESVHPFLNWLNDNVKMICQYGFTEMLNNAIDHSGGSQTTIDVEHKGGKVKIRIGDDGVGIFKKIKNHFGLQDERHAILELTKGKLTTDPRRHTGEGIFFTSRVFDSFIIMSDRLDMSCRQGRDWILDSATTYPGTLIVMEISADSDRKIKDVFDHYTADAADYGFDKTTIALSLVEYGKDNLVSRSQAKRLLARADRFREVVLDFRGIASIGQAFADEIFRVFQQEHPEIRIHDMDANDAVRQMIARAQAAARQTNDEARA